MHSSVGDASVSQFIRNHRWTTRRSLTTTPNWSPANVTRLRLRYTYAEFVHRVWSPGHREGSYKRRQLVAGRAVTRPTHIDHRRCRAIACGRKERHWYRLRLFGAFLRDCLDAVQALYIAADHA